jgi:hypothetical protein
LEKKESGQKKGDSRNSYLKYLKSVCMLNCKHWSFLLFSPSPTLSWLVSSTYTSDSVLVSDSLWYTIWIEHFIQFCI